MIPSQNILCLGCHDPVSRQEATRLTTLGFAVTVDTGRVDPLRHPALRPDILCGYHAVVIWNDLSVLTEVIRVFPGTIIFRSFGTQMSIQGVLWQAYVQSIVQARSNVRFVFSQPEDCAREQAFPFINASWTPQTAAELPEHMYNSWEVRAGGDRPLALLVPAASGDQSTRRLRRFIDERFGTGPFQVIEDQRGGSEVHLTLRESAGLLYPFVNEPEMPQTVISMLLLAGPIIYLQGSQLQCRIGAGAPGEAATIDQALEHCERLRSGDRHFINQILHAQLPASRHFHPSNTLPGFDAHFGRLLTATTTRIPDDDEAPLFHEAGHWGALNLVQHLLQAAGGDEVLQRQFLESMYHVILQREPDSAGFANHLEYLANGGRPDITMSAFLSSAEARGRWNDIPLISWLMTEK